MSDDPDTEHNPLIVADDEVLLPCSSATFTALQEAEDKPKEDEGPSFMERVKQQAVQPPQSHYVSEVCSTDSEHGRGVLV